MNDVLKQRLVGALILVALGVVFWPIIFVGPGSEDTVEHRDMPPVPVVPAQELPAPDRVGLRASEPAVIHEEPLEPEPAPLRRRRARPAHRTDQSPSPRGTSSR